METTVTWANRLYHNMCRSKGVAEGQGRLSSLPLSTMSPPQFQCMDSSVPRGVSEMVGQSVTSSYWEMLPQCSFTFFFSLSANTVAIWNNWCPKQQWAGCALGTCALSHWRESLAGCSHCPCFSGSFYELLVQCSLLLWGWWWYELTP